MLILAINIGFSRFSFQQNFTQYIEEVKLKRLDGFKKTLAELYRQKGSWHFLHNAPQSWHQLLSKAELVPPQRKNNPEQHEGNSPALRSPDFKPPHGPPPFPVMWERISLLDLTYSLVIGPPPKTEDRRLPIELENKVIGYLSVQSLKPFRSELDRQFARKQLENLLLITLLSLLVAIISSLLLARIFNQPIARLVVMARQLTSGQFESRVNITSHDELGELATAFNELAETLQQNQNARRQWVTDISHELRTPLTVLRGELEAIEDGVRPLNKESIQSLSFEVEHLKRMIEDLYQLSLSDEGSLSYKKELTRPLKLLQRVIETFTNAMKMKQITLTFECKDDSPQLLADPQRLTQLFTNLLENSLRYTDEGGTINIHCQISSTLVIYIEDSSPSVSSEMIPRLFERLFRADNSRNRSYGGSGLGLSIVQSIVTAHNGTVMAEPSTLGGLKISLTLPIKSRDSK